MSTSTTQRGQRRQPAREQYGDRREQAAIRHARQRRLNEQRTREQQEAY